LGDFVHQVAPPLGQGEADEASVATVVAPHHQTLLDQSIAHARGGGGCDSHRFGELDQALRTAGRKHHECPVLREGHLLGDVTE